MEIINRVTNEGRFPCWDCTLKHLGTAGTAIGCVHGTTIGDLLERSRIFLSESVVGYPDHQWLLVGAFNIIENNVNANTANYIRSIRKEIMERDSLHEFIINFDEIKNKLIFYYKIDITKPLEMNFNEYTSANLFEAKAECPDSTVSDEISIWLSSGRKTSPLIMEWIFQVSAKKTTYKFQQETV